MWRWTRKLNLSNWAGLISMIAYAFTPKALAHLGFGHVGLYYGYAYIPWIFWSIEHVAQGSRKHIFYLAIFFGFQCIASPQLAVYSALIALTDGLIQTLGIDQVRFSIQRLIKPLLNCMVGLGLGILLSAVQTLPALRFAGMSGRQGLSVEETAISALPLRYLLGFLLADHQGYMEYMVYTGVPTLALALYALLGRKHRSLMILAVLGLIYSMGSQTPLYAILYHLTPVSAWLRSPGRSMLVVMALLALLAGVGFDRIGGSISEKIRRRINILLAGCGFGALLLLSCYTVIVGHPALNLIAFGAITPATMLIMGLIQNKKIQGALAGWLMSGLLMLDLWVVDATLIEGRAHEDVFKDRAIGEYFTQRRLPDYFRIYSPNYSLPRQIGAYYGLETADGVDPLYLQDYDIFMQSASGVKRARYDVTIPAMESGGEIATINRKAIPNLKLLGILNVNYLASSFTMKTAGLTEIARFGENHIYANEYALPRAYLVGQVIPVSGLQEAIQKANGVDLTQIGLVEKGFPLDERLSPTADVQWLINSPNRIVLSVKTDNDAYLVISQTFYPDWRVIVDGETTTLYKTNGIVSGLYLRCGDHIVEMVYIPIYAYLGLAISITTALFLLIELASGVFKNARSNP